MFKLISYVKSIRDQTLSIPEKTTISTGLVGCTIGFLKDIDWLALVSFISVAATLAINVWDKYKKAKIKIEQSEKLLKEKIRLAQVKTEHQISLLEEELKREQAKSKALIDELLNRKFDESNEDNE